MPSKPRPSSRSAAVVAPKSAARRQLAVPADKFAARRSELAQATLLTLADLGYARTSLREIAQNSDYSHGVLHYYFSDKLDLISCSIREYKRHCATRYDDVIASARSADELANGFLARLGETLQNDARVHSLWYDLRSQALFEGFLREDVAEIDLLLQDMVWRVVSCYAAFKHRPLAVTSEAAYALMDGLFQRALLQQVSGDADALKNLQKQTSKVMPLLLG